MALLRERDGQPIAADHAKLLQDDLRHATVTKLIQMDAVVGDVDFRIGRRQLAVQIDKGVSPLPGDLADERRRPGQPLISLSGVGRDLAQLFVPRWRQQNECRSGRFQRLEQARIARLELLERCGRLGKGRL